MPTVEEYRRHQLSEQRSKAQNAPTSQEVENLIRDFKKFVRFEPKWIKEGSSPEMIEACEFIGRFMAHAGKNDNQALTKSQIRNVFGEIKRIQIKGFENEKKSFYLLKPKVAYNAGRHNKLGILVFKEYFNLAHACVENASDYEHFCDFFEAILAYHKAHGGKD
jgi:CRISPR-associated protein Csm2